MGKRVAFSARSVITPDPKNIKIDELRSKRLAMNLHFHIVTKYNKKILQTYVRNGPIHPEQKC